MMPFPWNKKQIQTTMLFIVVVDEFVAIGHTILLLLQQLHQVLPITWAAKFIAICKVLPHFCHCFSCQIKTPLVYKHVSWATFSMFLITQQWLPCNIFQSCFSTIITHLMSWGIIAAEIRNLPVLLGLLKWGQATIFQYYMITLLLSCPRSKWDWWGWLEHEYHAFLTPNKKQ